MITATVNTLIAGVQARHQPGAKPVRDDAKDRSLAFAQMEKVIEVLVDLDLFPLARPNLHRAHVDCSEWSMTPPEFAHEYDFDQTPEVWMAWCRAWLRQVHDTLKHQHRPDTSWDPIKSVKVDKYETYSQRGWRVDFQLDDSDPLSAASYQCTVRFVAWTSTICERVQVGTRTVKVPVTFREEEQPVYEERCRPLLDL